MKTVIIDYGSGNLRSAQKAVEKVATGTVMVSSQAEDVAAADRIILPGVGAFGDCMKGLCALDGMVEALEEAVIRAARPFLGICVGMQLLADRGVEHGTHKGLGWIKGTVVPLELADNSPLKIPHMGWNDLKFLTPHPLFEGLGDGDHAYFVHSYQFDVTDPAVVLAKVEYGASITAIIGRDNIIGTQFHPEKSQKTGLAMLANFMNWTP